jgi:hypothetical protein
VPAVLSTCSTWRRESARGSEANSAGTLGDLLLDRDTLPERRTVNEERERLEAAVRARVHRGLTLPRG